jgi:hypothetical protein
MVYTSVIGELQRVLRGIQVGGEKLDRWCLLFAKQTESPSTTRGAVEEQFGLLVENDTVDTMVIFLVAQDINCRSYMRELKNQQEMLAGYSRTLEGERK